jgi:hypothetical protein
MHDSVHMQMIVCMFKMQMLYVRAVMRFVHLHDLHTDVRCRTPTVQICVLDYRYTVCYTCT